MYTANNTGWDGTHLGSLPALRVLRSAKFGQVLILGMLAVFFTQSLSAAPLNLEAAPGSPIVDTNNSFIKYDFTPGSGGTLTIEGLYDDPGDPYYNPSDPNPVSQTLFAPLSWGVTTPSNPSLAIVNEDALTNDPLTMLINQTLYDTGYTLTANFDASGAFTGGSYSITGVVDASAATLGIEHIPQFDPTGPCGPTCGQGNLMSGELLAFGFAGTPTVSGDQDTLLLEFNISVTGGDFYNAGFGNDVIRSDIGIIANGDVSYGTLNPLVNGSYGAEWDPDELNVTAAFQDDFISCDGCAVDLKTFVPVPAAVWLFGSGLAGLMGLGARNRRRKEIIRS